MENLLLGIDLGTSSVKAALFRLNGEMLYTEAEKYDIEFPAAGFEEENPDIWWEKTCLVLRRLTQRLEREGCGQIIGTGLSGQMHGLVALDQNNAPLMPCILWSDGRSGQIIERFERQIDMDAYYKQTANMPSTGFMLFSLLWLKEERPEVFGRIHKVIFPKDYIRMKLTRNVATDLTDASGSGMLNVNVNMNMNGKRLSDDAKKDSMLHDELSDETSDFDSRLRGCKGQKYQDYENRNPYGMNWNTKLCQDMGIPLNILPDIHDSCCIAGRVEEEVSRITGLPAGIPVVYGSGDSMAQQLGVGAVKPGDLVSNIGTGSQITCLVRHENINRAKELNCFVHSVKGLDILSGASLNGGVVMKWINDKVFSITSFDELVDIAAGVSPGADGVGFVPYLSGERCPRRSDTASGTIYGLKLSYGKEHICRAVIEGMLYALRDNLTYIEKCAGMSSDYIAASGGGAKNPFLLQLQADIFRKKVVTAGCEEQACLGAALYAGVGCGVFRDLGEAAERTVKYAPLQYEPNAANADLYDAAFRKYIQVRDVLWNVEQNL